MKKLQSDGAAHYALLIAVAVIVGVVGAYVVIKSKAATAGYVVSGTATQCGSAYSNTYDPNQGGGSLAYAFENIKYTNARNSTSVANFAKFICEKGFLDSKNALSINSSGNWSSKLKAGIKNYELSQPKLKAAADGMPDAKLICTLGEGSYVNSEGATYYFYQFTPTGFPNNDCYSLLGTAKEPSGK